MTGFGAAFEGLLDCSIVSIMFSYERYENQVLTQWVVLVVPCWTLWDDEMCHSIVQLEAV